MIATVQFTFRLKFKCASFLSRNPKDIINLVHQYLDDVKVEVKKDLSERDRMLFILKNIE